MPDALTCMKIEELAAAGHAHSFIGNAVGLHQTTITRTLQKPEIAARIEKLQNKVADQYMEDAVENFGHAITSYRKLGPKDDFQLREHGFKASVEICRSIGILPSHAPSIMVQNVLNVSQTVNSPIVDRLLNQVSGGGECIDITPEDED